MIIRERTGYGGERRGKAPIDPERAFARYTGRVGFDSTTRQLQREISGMYDEFVTILDDTYPLIVDFTELYRKCHGIIQNRIYAFSRRGYDTVAQISQSDGEEK